LKQLKIGIIGLKWDIDSADVHGTTLFFTGRHTTGACESGVGRQSPRLLQPERRTPVINTKLRQQLLIVLLLASFLFLPIQSAFACSRAVYFGKDGQTVTGRSMDWPEDMHTNLWIFPRGMNRDGGMGDRGFKWTSKYGSVIASVYEAGTSDGMNETGLVANLLFLVETEYPSAEGDPRPPLPISAWAQ
jgi:hypothetical protein